MRTVTLSALALVLGATAALAQAPPPPPGGPGGPGARMPGAEAPQPPMPAGPRGAMDGPSAPGMRSPPPPPPSKAAHFRLEGGDMKIDVKCADDEPMRACADIAAQLIDKLAGSARR